MADGQQADQFRPSALWKNLQQGVFRDAATIDLGTFRRPGTLNNRLAAWDPIARDHRYYKTILFNTASAMPDRFFELYRQLDTSLGDPVSVKVRGVAVDLDYLLSVDELLFLEDTLANVASICEIGAGFGRTCHALLATRPEITRYTIIDLPETIALSRRYLRQMLDDALFQKIAFVPADGAHDVSAHDCFINIDSMAEMDADVVRNYQRLIDARGASFYTKNTVGKYTPENVGITQYNQQELEAALAAGVLTQIVDIFDDAAIADAATRYEEVMRPGESWTLARSAPSVPWMYFRHALYLRNEARR
jgi:hypothetical protein